VIAANDEVQLHHKFFHCPLLLPTWTTPSGKFTVYGAREASFCIWGSMA